MTRLRRSLFVALIRVRHSMRQNARRADGKQRGTHDLEHLCDVIGRE